MKRYFGNTMQFASIIRYSIIWVSVILLSTASALEAQVDTSIPPQPNVKVIAGDNEVIIYWDDTAESFIDPWMVTNRPGLNPRNFEGYKVYKSTDPNFNDARRITDNAGNLQGLRPVVQFDRINQRNGYHPTAHNGQRFWIGSETGIQRVYVDTDVLNGRNYYYAVVAYTHGDALPDFEIPIIIGPGGTIQDPPFPNEYFIHRPRESEIDIQVNADGSVTMGTNVVSVTPTPNFSGYRPPVDPVVTRLSGSAGGSISVEIIDPAELQANTNYRITFTDTIIPGATSLDPDLVATKGFFLQNLNTQEFIFDNEDRFRTEQLLIKEGLLVTVKNAGDTVRVNPLLSNWSSASDNSIHSYAAGVATRNAKLADYRIEFSDEAVSRSREFTLTVGALSQVLPEEDVNFKVFNTTTNEEIPFAFFSNPAIPRSFLAATFIDENKGFIVGGAGVVRRTDDGGASFTIQDVGTTEQLNAVYFVDDTNGWIVGNNGTVIRTTDGGDTWQLLSNNVVRHFLDVWFLDASIGYASSTTIRVGTQNQSRVYRTTDGGFTWNELDLISPRNLNAIYFTNPSTGYIVGVQGELLTSTDGGLTWARRLPIISPRVLRDVHFSTPDSGWVVGALGTILATIDAGATWTAQNSGFADAQLNAVTFVNNTTGWAVGQNGNIVHTTDGGATWTSQNSGTTTDLFSVKFVTPLKGFAFGNGPTVVETLDGGVSWVPVTIEKRFRAYLEPGPTVDDPPQARSDEIYFIEEFGGTPDLVTWKVSMVPDIRGSSDDPGVGDVLNLITIKPFTSSDVYEFSIADVNVPGVEPTVSKDVLDAVRVVPNPYLVSNLIETPYGAYGGERQLHFTNLPAVCSIRIFTVSGQLIQTLNVDNSTSLSDRYIWNMRTSQGEPIAYGVYIYHIEAPGVGEKVGKFAVIK